MAELKLMDNKFSTPKSEQIKNNLSLRSKFSGSYKKGV